jgi:putative membrane protein
VALVVRGSIGGGLMGLANLVPGISGGTMLLAVGIYPAFISALAELTRFRLRAPTLLLVGCVALGAGVAILLLAGPTKTLVVEQRWIMYSLFVGLTLGGVPLVLRLARRVSVALVAGAVAGLLLMLVMSAAGLRGGTGGETSQVLLGLSGLAAASAMILPGISGGYLLLLLGQYETILAAIDRVKQALLGGELGLLPDALAVLGPLAIGVLAGLVGVSNLLSWLLRRFDNVTLGVLLGLLLGAVVGLWPFQQGVAPVPGELLDGRLLDAAQIAALERDRWPVRFFEPNRAQVLSALALIGLGFGGTWLDDRIGRRLEARDT